MFLKDGVAKSSSKKLLAVCAVLLLAAVCFSVAIASDESDAADPTIKIKSQKMEVGKDYTLEIEVSPEGTQYTNLRWDLDDTTGEKATLDKSKGIITTKSKGTINVTATVKIDSKDVTTTKSFTIIQQVTKVEILDGTTTVTKKDMLLGEEATLTAKVSPSNADEKSVTWESSNTSIVTVDNGKVKAIATGTAVVKATSVYNQKLSASCSITVTNVPVTGINVSSSATVDVGGNTTITATISPENATNKEIEIANSDSSVINVVSKTLNKNIYTITLKGVKEGKSTITVTTKDGNFKGTCNVTSKPVPVTGVKLNHDKITLEATGSKSTYTLTPTIEPSNATYKGVTWTSSDSNIATVNEKGLVTGIKPGVAIVTVKTDDGGKTASCEVTVSSDLTINATLSGTGSIGTVTNSEQIYESLNSASSKGLTPTVMVYAEQYDQVNMTSGIVKSLKTFKEGELDIQVHEGAFMFSRDSIGHLDNSGNMIGFSIKKIDLGEKYKEYEPIYAYEICMYVDGEVKPVSFGSSPALIGLDHQLKSDEKVENLIVCYVRDSGKPLKVSEYEYVAGSGVLFSAPHFSKYAFVFHEADIASGEYNLAVIIIALIVIIVLAILLILFIRSEDGIEGMFKFKRRNQGMYQPPMQY